MAKQSPRWRGIRSKTEIPEGIDYEASAAGQTLVRIFEGGYEELRSAIPKMGTADPDYPAGQVDKVKLQRLRGGKGRLTITLVNTKSVVEEESPATFQPIFEVEWTQIERPIEASRLYNRNIAGCPKPLSDADLDKLHAWEQAPSAAARTAAFAQLSTNAKHCAQKKMLGISTVLLFAPVARLTQQAYNCPNTGPCGSVVTEPPDFGPNSPSGYKWLKTADRATRTGLFGKWQRVQEWTGAEWWDPDLYPS